MVRGEQVYIYLEVEEEIFLVITQKTHAAQREMSITSEIFLVLSL